MLRGTVVMFQLSSGCFQVTCDLWRRRFPEDSSENGEAAMFQLLKTIENQLVLSLPLIKFSVK